MITISELSPKDMPAIASMKLRESDRLEAEAFAGVPANDGLVLGCQASEFVWVVKEDGDIIAVFGLWAQHSQWGMPWFLATDRVYVHKTKWLRLSKEWRDQLLKRRKYLTNYVSSAHTEAIRWLEWLGFTVDRNKEFTFSKPNVTFYQFFAHRR